VAAIRSTSSRHGVTGSARDAKHFSVKVGTIMGDSPIGLDKWLCAMWLLGNFKNGISSYEIARDLTSRAESASSSCSAKRRPRRECVARRGPDDICRPSRCRRPRQRARARRARRRRPALVAGRDWRCVRSSRQHSRTVAAVRSFRLALAADAVRDNARGRGAPAIGVLLSSLRAYRSRVRWSRTTVPDAGCPN
jgi:hypothetical protein